MTIEAITSHNLLKVYGSKVEALMHAQFQSLIFGAIMPKIPLIRITSPCCTSP